MNRIFRWVWVAILLTVTLGSCIALPSEAEGDQNVNPAEPKDIPPEAVLTPPETLSWKTYHSQQAGYSVEYPADWMVSEQVGTEDSIVTTFSSVDGGAGITVLVQSGEFGGAGSLDLPNTHCEEVPVGGLTGTRCFDTLSSGTSTAVVSQAKTYIIMSTSKRVDPTIYDRFLNSFKLR